MKTILLCAGHSQADPGAVANGYTEARLALALRDALALELSTLGARVLTDGQYGVNLPLRDAARMARNNYTGLNIEFHFNAGPPAAAGIEVLSQPQHRRLAQSIAAAIHNVTGSPLRGDRGWKPENAGQHHRLEFVQAGGLIVEAAFITNREDILTYRNRFNEVVASLARVLADAAGVEPAPQPHYAAVAQQPPSPPADTFEPSRLVAPGNEWPQQPPWEQPRPVPAQPSIWHRWLVGSDALTTIIGYVGAVAAYLSNPTKGGAIIAAIAAALGRFSSNSKQ